MVSEKKHRESVGQLARLYMQIELLLEQIPKAYTKTNLPSSHALALSTLEAAFVGVADGLVQILKKQRLEPKGHPLIFHGDMMFNLEQIVAWSEEAKA